MSEYEYLEKYADQVDDDIDLGMLALDMVRSDHEGISVDRYIQHFKKLSEEAKERYDVLIKEGADDDAGVRLAALKYVVSECYGYDVDSPEAEALESADMMRVIDRFKGCSAALCVIYMDVARKCGWHVEGLNFPKAFLCRIEHEGIRMIFDPAQHCKLLEAHELRERVKEALGDQAELASQYYDGLGPREVVVNLCNLVKLRYIEMADYKAALEVVSRMRTISPDEYRLLLDAGVLYARLRQNFKATQCLNRYIEMAPSHYDRQEAQILLNELLEDTGHTE